MSRQSVAPEIRALRRVAADHAFPPLTDLPTTLAASGFVQADPIRAPARAQDLILRQRVAGYRAGDLERDYATLPIFEDMVHVYGFVHRRHRSLLHPRRIIRRFNVEQEHPHLRRALLDHLAANGPSHPRQIVEALAVKYPRAAILNAWGGQSNATTSMLDILHYRGLLHVVRRERGIRVYALVSGKESNDATLSPVQRSDGLIRLLVSLYAPLPIASLRQLTWMLGERAMARDTVRARIPLLIRRGELRQARVAGVDWIRPAVDAVAVVPQPIVRFLAPFDPLVWDRRRFAFLWQWAYRFEAYTPLAKRRLGYYALPILWDDGDDANVIGWVNATRRDGRRIDLRAGYVEAAPRTKAYRQAFDAEAARLERFLNSDIADDSRSIPDH